MTTPALPGLQEALDNSVFDRERRSQWFTPPSLALRLARWAGGAIRLSRILEPSAGGGALVKAAIECGANPSAITAVELDPRWAHVLDMTPHLEVAHCDYLTRAPRDHRYDLALMNPPYEDGMDGVFLAKAMDESDRVIALIRTVALNGDDRYKRVWRRCADDGDFALVGVAFLVQRPDFGGAHGAMTDFVAVKLARRALAAGGEQTKAEWWAR